MLRFCESGLLLLRMLDAAQEANMCSPVPDNATTFAVPALTFAHFCQGFVDAHSTLDYSTLAHPLSRPVTRTIAKQLHPFVHLLPLVRDSGRRPHPLDGPAQLETTLISPDLMMVSYRLLAHGTPGLGQALDPLVDELSREVHEGVWADRLTARRACIRRRVVCGLDQFPVAHFVLDLAHLCLRIGL